MLLQLRPHRTNYISWANCLAPEGQHVYSPNRPPTSGFVRRADTLWYQDAEVCRSSERSSARRDIGAINISLLRSERHTDAVKIWLRLRRVYEKKQGAYARSKTLAYAPCAQWLARYLMFLSATNLTDQNV